MDTGPYLFTIHNICIYLSFLNDNSRTFILITVTFWYAIYVWIEGYLGRKKDPVWLSKGTPGPSNSYKNRIVVHCLICNCIPRTNVRTGDTMV